LNTSGILLQ